MDHQGFKKGECIQKLSWGETITTSFQQDETKGGGTVSKGKRDKGEGCEPKKNIIKPERLGGVTVPIWRNKKHPDSISILPGASGPQVSPLNSDTGGEKRELEIQEGGNYDDKLTNSGGGQDADHRGPNFKVLRDRTSWMENQSNPRSQNLLDPLLPRKADNGMGVKLCFPVPIKTEELKQNTVGS